MADETRDSSADNVLFEQLADEFAARYRAGEQPALAEYIDRHPALADAIRELFPALIEMEQAKADRPQLHQSTPSLPPFQQFGDFRILREVGKGGMGVVYEAEQVSLGRRVALKVLPRTMLLDGKARLRFEREARSAGKLHHTNIVPVFGVGEHEGLPYYVMQFIQGSGLDDVYDELKRMRSGGVLAVPPKEVSVAAVAPSAVAPSAAARSLLTGTFVAAERRMDTPSSGDSNTRPLSGSSVNLPGSGASAGSGSKSQKADYWRSVAHIGVQVAQALDYAHKQGIRHRDIKPSNLLLDTHGTVWVTDFGLARAENEDHLTQTGDIVGTLRYMPPEAFEGHSDARSDLYSTGLTLYELLALQPAFVEKDRHRLIKRVTTAEPPRLDKLNRAIPRDLVTIVHKAIDREPLRRYQTAAELAADLQRFLDDEPIRARQVSLRERGWRWCRRNPATAGLLAAVFLLLVAVAGLSSVAALHFAAARTQEQTLRQDADAARDRAVSARHDEEEQRRLAEAARTEAESQKQRAEENFRQARRAVDDYLTRVSENRLLRVPGMQPLRKDLLESALHYYEGFLRQQGQDTSLRKDLAAAYLRMAAINSEIGSPTEALAHCDKAREVLQDLQRENPTSDAVRLNLFTCYQTAGQLHRRLGKLTAALQSCQDAYRILLELSPQDPNRKAVLFRAKGTSANGIPVHSSPDAEILSRFFHSLNEMGMVYQQMGELGAALYRYDQALLIQQSLVRDHPRLARIVAFQHGLAGQLDRLGRLQAEIGMSGQARACYDEARNILERLLHEQPRHEYVADLQRDLAAVQENDAEVLAATGRLDAAFKAYEAARPLRQQLERENPAVTDYRNDLAHNYYQMSLLRLRANDLNGALPLLQQAVARERGLVATMPAMQSYVRMLGRQLGTQGSVQRQLGKTAEAGQSYQEARTLMEKLPPVQAGDFYELALWRAACADLTDEPARRDRDTGLALGALRQAIQTGYADLNRLEQDAELAPLRPRQEFQEMVEDVRRKTKTLHWTEDLDAARVQAAKENKDLFLWFGASDWAPLDSIQRKTRFERAAFIDYATKHFVMVDLDWPKYKPEPKSFAKRTELARKWQITGIPYAVLADARGRAYAIQGADREGKRSLEELLKDLEQRRRGRIVRDDLLAQAAASTGLAKARGLDQALGAVPSQFVLDYLDEIAEILELDRDNEAGLRSKYLTKAAAIWPALSRKILVLRQNRLAADPKNTRLQADLAASQHEVALLQFDAGKLGDARKCLEQAVALRDALADDEPQNARYQREATESRCWLYLVRARLLVPSQRGKEAKSDLAELAQLRPDSPKLWQERGRLYFELGQTELAVADFRKAVELLGDKALPSKPPVSEADKLFARLADDALLQRLTAAVERNAGDVAPRWQRGIWYARHGRFKESADDYRMALQRTRLDYAEQWLQVAPVLVAAGDLESYRRLRRDMVKELQATQDPPIAERAAKGGLLLPDAGKDTEAVCQLADRSVALGQSHAWLHYFVFSKGLADYRRGDFRAVVEELDPQFIAGIRSIGDLAALSHLVLAMTHHRQGHAQAARDHLAEGGKLLKRHLPDLSSFHMERDDYRNDWLIAWLLYQEAQTLIEGKRIEPQK